MATKKAAKKKSAKSADIIEMLKEDHERVRAMFEEFEGLDPEEDREAMQAIVEQTCAELEVHATLEEELFYPQVREALEEADIVDEAEVEHQSARDLIEQLKALAPDDAKYAATFKVLGEYVNHHVEEEEGEMFKQVKKAKALDLEAMAEEAKTRKAQLMAEMGLATEDEAAEEQ
jgi:hemerythrin superfamily protein